MLKKMQLRRRMIAKLEVLVQIALADGRVLGASRAVVPHSRAASSGGSAPCCARASARTRS